MAEKSGDISRRSFLNAGVVGLAALHLDPRDPMQPSSAPRRQPNFIFITTDGHRPDALSLNGNPIIRTPNFDRIGREGIEFRQAFVVNALCLPARATALTGL